MSILIDAARLIGNVGVLGRNVFGPNGLQVPYQGSVENQAASLTSTFGDFGGFLAGGLRIGVGLDMELMARNLSPKFGRVVHPDDLAKLEKAGPTTSMGSFILWTLTVVEALELTMGFGPPHEGGDLEAGSAQFTAICEQLVSAVPDEHWQGSASQAYADQARALHALAKTMAELDLKLAEIVKNQADWVTHMRLGFGILKNLLFAAFVMYWAIMLTLPNPANIYAAKAFEIAVCLAGITATVGMLGTLIGFSTDNGLKADAVTVDYLEAAAGAMPSGTPMAGIQVPGVQGTTVSGFAYASAGSASMPLLSAAPDVSNVAAGGGDSEGERAPLSALTAQGETNGDAAPEIPATPQASATTTLASAVFAMPTLGQLAPWQTAKPSGNVTPHAKIVEQAKGQIQQLAQMARRAQEEAAPDRDALVGVPPVAVHPVTGDAEPAGLEFTQRRELVAG